MSIWKEDSDEMRCGLNYDRNKSSTVVHDTLPDRSTYVLPKNRYCTSCNELLQFSLPRYTFFIVDSSKSKTPTSRHDSPRKTAQTISHIIHETKNSNLPGYPDLCLSSQSLLSDKFLCGSCDCDTATQAPDLCGIVLGLPLAQFCCCHGPCPHFYHPMHSL